MIKNIKELLRQNIISIALLPDKNDSLLNEEGRELRSDLIFDNKEKRDKLVKEDYSGKSEDKLRYLDLKRFDDTSHLFITLIDHDYEAKTPKMHNAIFSKLGFNSHRLVYVVADLQDYDKIFNVFEKDDKYKGGGVRSGFRGFAANYLSRYGILDTSALDLKSVTVISKLANRKLNGYNTDGLGYRLGLERYLRELNENLEGKKVLVLGAGDITLPILYEVSKLKPSNIVVLNRTIQKAERISDKIKSIYGNMINVGGENLIGEEMKDSFLVINTSRKGTEGVYTAFAPTNERHYETTENNLNNLPKNAIVSDIILPKNGVTRTIELARKKGYRTQTGESMFLYQGIYAFKISTGLDIEDSILESIIKESLLLK